MSATKVRKVLKSCVSSSNFNTRDKLKVICTLYCTNYMKVGEKEEGEKEEGEKEEGEKEGGEKEGGEKKGGREEEGGEEGVGEEGGGDSTVYIVNFYIPQSDQWDFRSYYSIITTSFFSTQSDQWYFSLPQYD